MKKKYLNLFIDEKIYVIWLILDLLKKNEDLNLPEKPTIREITIDLFEKYIFDEKSSTKNKLVFIDMINASEEIYFVEKIISQNAWEIVFLWHRIIKEEPEKWTKISRKDYKKKKKKFVLPSQN